MAKRGVVAGPKAKGVRKVVGANQVIAKRKAAGLGKVASFKERGGYGLRGK